jgi:hypothetical protein
MPRKQWVCKNHPNYRGKLPPGSACADCLQIYCLARPQVKEPPSRHKGTPHAWRVQKRREVRAAEKAVRALLLGAHFTPVDDIGGMLRTLERWKRAMGVDYWGR